MATPTKAKGFKDRSAGKPSKASPAAAWKKAKEAVLELPSGLHATVHRPGMEKFLQAGFLPDSLAEEIQRQIKLAQGTASTKIKQEEKKILESLDSVEIEELLDAMNRITEMCVLDPKVQWHKRFAVDEDGEPLYEDEAHTRQVTEIIPDEDRDGEIVYTDEIDQDDKNFIFQYAVGGSSDLTRFRQQSESFMDAVAASGSVEDKTVGDTGD